MQSSSLFPHHEYQKYKMLYSEVSQDKTAISYRDFVSIVKQIKIFDSMATILFILNKLKSNRINYQMKEVLNSKDFLIY